MRNGAVPAPDHRDPAAGHVRPGTLEGVNVGTQGARLPAVLSALIIITVACTPAEPAPGAGFIEVRAVAGPVCPVERDPPDPACAPRPVPDARIVVHPMGEPDVVAEGSTDHAGIVLLEVAPGDYVVAGGEVAGMFGVPEPTGTSVRTGMTTFVELAWDTGIR